MCPQVNDPRVEYSVCLLDAEYVDGHDILSATMEAMTRAVQGLEVCVCVCECVCATMEAMTRAVQGLEVCVCVCECVCVCVCVCTVLLC
jgi:ribonuclease HII